MRHCDSRIAIKCKVCDKEMKSQTHVKLHNKVCRNKVCWKDRKICREIKVVKSRSDKNVKYALPNEVERLYGNVIETLQKL